MAVFIRRSLISTALHFCSVVAVSIVATPVVRREHDAIEHVQLEPGGHLKPVQADRYKPVDTADVMQYKERHFAQASLLQVPTECDRQYLMMVEGNDTCSGQGDPQEVLAEDDCNHAATTLGIAKATANLNDHLVNPLPYPRGCFVNHSAHGDEIFYNEDDTAVGITLIGRKLCMRNLYSNGTEDKNPTDGCTGDQVPILNYTKCLYASACQAGGNACKLPAFEYDDVDSTYTDRPQGCFKISNGCWGFNKLTTPATAANLTGTPVCLNTIPGATTTAAPAT